MSSKRKKNRVSSKFKTFLCDLKNQGNKKTTYTMGKNICK